MVLSIEDEQITVIKLPRRGARRRRSAAQMCDFDCRSEEDASSPGPDCRAEIDVFQVHEVALVHQANGHGLGPAHQQARPCHPIRVPLALRISIDVASRDPLLANLRERRHHRAERQLGSSAAVDQTRADDGDLSVAVEG